MPPLVAMGPQWLSEKVAFAATTGTLPAVMALGAVLSKAVAPVTQGPLPPEMSLGPKYPDGPLLFGYP